MIDCLSRGVDDTHLIAAAIARLVRPRDMVVLSGDMGAGKTAFTIGFANALAVDSEEYVSSPTFNLVQSYTSGRIPIQHAESDFLDWSPEGEACRRFQELRKPLCRSSLLSAKLPWVPVQFAVLRRVAGAYRVLRLGNLQNPHLSTPGVRWKSLCSDHHFG